MSMSIVIIGIRKIINLLVNFPTIPIKLRVVSREVVPDIRKLVLCRFKRIKGNYNSNNYSQILI